MKIEFEMVQPDEGSSLRIIHNKTNAEEYPWSYHYHPEYEIVCVLYGSGARHVGNHFSNYENGDLVFMGPNLPHAGFGLNAHGPHEEIVIQIKESVLRQSILPRPEMAAIHQLLERVRCGVSFHGQTKEQISRRLVDLLKMNPFDKYMELVSILQQMATTTEYQLLNPLTVFSSSIVKNNIRIQNVFNYVEQHYQEEIDIKDIARVANLSVSSFCTYFKKNMHSTFTDFLNKFRIQKACLQLLEGNTIAETCFACGFNHVPYFNKVFKSVTGKTPSEYKKQKLKVA